MPLVALFEGIAAVEDQSAVKEQNILSVEIQNFLQICAGNIADIDQGHGFIVLDQQGRQAAAEGITENNEFPV